MKPDMKSVKEKMNEAAEKGGILNQLNNERFTNGEYAKGKNPRSFRNM